MKSLNILVVLAGLLGAQAVAYAGSETPETAQQAIDRIVRQSAAESGPDNGPVRELVPDYQSGEKKPARAHLLAAQREC